MREALPIRVEDPPADAVVVLRAGVMALNDLAAAAVAKILRVDHEGHIELQVLPGDVESHRDLLTFA